ncbi:hypothetical protein EG329_003299 [Mollisiaceae sp. DMI_Dod_QoI]|nr:hypothetical protein EG329_003299 [Helotiales sp. DMI_Dod_QoI]
MASTNIPVTQPTGDKDAAALAASCGTCCSLHLDDKYHGGFSKELQNGRHVLEFEGDGRMFIVNDFEDILPGLPKLTASSQDGCTLCGFLKQVIIDAIYTGQNQDRSQPERTVFIGLSYQWNITINPRLDADTPDVQGDNGPRAFVAELEIAGVYTETVLFSVYSSDDLVASWLRINRPPELHALCDQNVRLIENHIHDCVDNHRPPYHPGSYIPTRLIDLGCGSTRAHPRLIVTADMIKNGLLRPEDFKYAALSYCWGPSGDAVTQTKTERDSFIARLQEIPRHEMSLVMRDAIKVCEALELRFLWIDSLCIVQDDLKDWERESEQMGSIYLHSFISICAPASSSCHQGFLNRQNRKANVIFQSSVNPAIKGTYTIEEVGLASQLGKDYPGHCTPYNIDVKVSSWGSRGWVYQERALSVRKLVFGRSMFHYSCPLQTVSENGHVQVFSPSELETTPLLPTFQAIKDRVLRDEDIHMAWSEICRDYASLQLTQPLDKLPALSGLAKLFASFLEDSSSSYIAGIWKIHLLRGYGLLWLRRPVQSREELLQHFRAPQSYIAPTWSWAHHGGTFLPGFLHYHWDGNSSHLHSRIEFQRLDAYQAAGGTNQFGRILEGVVSMTGKLASFSTLSVSRKYPSTFARRLREAGKYIADCVLDWVTSDNGEDQRSLLLLPLLSNCAGTTLNSFIFSEVVDIDTDSVEKYDEPRTPPGDTITFSHILLSKLGEGSNSEQTEEDTSIIPNIRPPGDLTTFAQSCYEREMDSRDTFGIILHPAESPDRYWRVGTFYSQARQGGGTALFRNIKYEEFQIV